MKEQKTINVDKNIPLSERIALVSREVSEWIKTLEAPLIAGKDVVFLAKYKRNGKYTYQYAIERGGNF